MNKDLLIRFVLGGGAVMVSYLITVISPWKILAGIFAAFPAVMITAVLMMGIDSGSKKAAKIANGSVYGMIGGVVCVATVWIVLEFSNNWPLSLILGLIAWLSSSILVAKIREGASKLGSRRTSCTSKILVESQLRQSK